MTDGSNGGIASVVWPVSQSYARRVVIALIVEPVGLGLGSAAFVMWPMLGESVLGRVVGVFPLFATAIAIFALQGAALRVVRYTRQQEHDTLGYQKSHYSLRFGWAGNQVFARAEFPSRLRWIQRLLSAAVPVAALAALLVAP